MKTRIKALRSLRWNYRWRGVWAWLKGRHRVLVPIGGGRRQEVKRCGYQRILSEPEQVIAEQEATAEGVFV